MANFKIIRCLNYASKFCRNLTYFKNCFIVSIPYRHHGAIMYVGKRGSLCAVTYMNVMNMEWVPTYVPMYG